MTTPTQAVASSQQPAGAIRHGTVTIDGIPVFGGSATEALEACFALIERRAGGRIATANLDFLALARRNVELRGHLADSSLVVADGMPVVWLGKLAGARGIQRLAGADLVRELFATRAARQLRIAVYGSTAEICGRATEVLHAAGEGARIVHAAHPPFRPLTDDEVQADLDALISAQVDVVLVALGCPAQERLIAEWHPLLPNVVWIGVGGTLDFYAGHRKRAPKFAQRFGFEWMVRMAQEPRRLGRRYLGRDLPALVAIAPGCLRSRLTAAKPSAR